MITIDQLLESVDLDFEPRWVTKDKVGTVWLWSTKPSRLEKLWGNSTEQRHSVGFLILSEFHNKSWQECIYEVPRKTTGKIEKFDYPVSSPFYIEHNIIMDKINELVDAVNELKENKGAIK